MTNLSNLTIVIPSYNRQNYIRRQINFWKDFDAKVFILDGSSGSISVDTPNHIEYFHMKESLEKRLGEVIKKIATKYSVLLSDDEFYIPLALELCMEYLDNNKDFAAVKGLSLGFRWDKKLNCVIGNKQYPEHRGYLVDSNSSKIRMVDHMQSYQMVALWSVMPSHVFKKTLAIGSKPIHYSTPIALEMQISLVSSYLGKLKVLDELMWLRSFENINTWANPGLLRFDDWLLCVDYQDEVNNFVSSIVERLNGSDSVFMDVQEALKVYLEYRSKKVRLLESEKRGKALKRIFAKLTTIFDKYKLFATPNSYSKDEPLKISLLQLAWELSQSGAGVDMEGIKSIDSIISKFHLDSTSYS